MVPVLEFMPLDGAPSTAPAASSGCKGFRWLAFPPVRVMCVAPLRQQNGVQFTELLLLPRPDQGS